MKRHLTTLIAVLLPAALAGTAAAQVVSTLPGPVGNIPRIYMPGPRITPYAPMPEIMPGMPYHGVTPVMPIPKILPIMPAPRMTPVLPIPRIMPIMSAAMNVRLAAPAKDGSSGDAVEARKKLDRLFDGRATPVEPKTPVEQPADGSAVRPGRQISFPEQDLEREIGVAETNLPLKY